MRPLSYLPNLLSSLRIALAPAMLGAAYSNSKEGFAVLLAVTVATDLVDGVFARAWGAESELGRRLDRWGDGLTASLGAVGVFFLWPHVLEREWPWALAAAGGYLMIGLQRWIQPATANSYSRWPAKVLGLAPPLSLVPLMQGWAEWPFQAAAVVQAGIGAWKLMGAIGRADKATEEASPAAE